MITRTDHGSPTSVVAVDLGKSRCRVRVDTSLGETTTLAGVGAPGLASAGGVDEALSAILTTVAGTIPVDALIGVGAAGALSAPAQAAALALRLSESTGARVAVASDVITAHLGALGGTTGVLLIAGTGAVALGIHDDGHRLVDGWGPDLGDLGSGSWIGRSALLATLRAGVELGPSTALTAELAASTVDPVRWLAESPHTARRLAGLAPVVIRHAENGDAVGAAIVEEAARLLAASAKAASKPGSPVALHGGLTDHDWFRARVQDALRSVGLVGATGQGDALDGAARIALGDAPLHERFVHRAG